MYLDPASMFFVVIPALILISALLFIANQYKRCPSNKIIVVYGKTGSNTTAKCVHGGGVFVIPLIQDYGVLSLEPADGGRNRRSCRTVPADPRWRRRGDGQTSSPDNSASPSAPDPSFRRR